MSFEIIIILLFIIVPSIWWRVTTGGNAWFLPWVGLKRVEKKSVRSFWLSIGLAALYMLTVITAHSLIFPMVFLGGFDENLAEFDFGTIIMAIVMGIVPGSSLLFAMEFFFRGFLGKRLIGKLGFAKGNTIQAIVYGLLLGGIALMMAINADLELIIFPATFFLIFVSFGWVAGYIAEKQAGGSIIPSCAVIITVVLIHILPAYFISTIYR